MSTNSAIEWTEATWNPVAGCARVSAGCDHCYAVTMTNRLEAMGQQKYAGLTVLNGKGDRHFNGKVYLSESDLSIPLERKKPTVYFVNSMSDLFHKDVPFEFIDKVFAVINATQTQLPLPEDISLAKPWHTYQILTKRTDRMAEYMSSRFGKFPLGEHPIFKARRLFMARGPDLMNASACLTWPPDNAWLGTSVENKACLHRIDKLRECIAAVRFLSLEPLLEDLGVIDLTGIHWVIVGGESGKGARPCNVKWVRGIVRQCHAASVPVFVKQMGARVELPNDRASEWGREGDVLSWENPDARTYQGEEEIARLEDHKGGDPDEWPLDLRVREMPAMK